MEPLQQIVILGTHEEMVARHARHTQREGEEEVLAAVLDVTTFNSYRGDVLATWPIEQVEQDLGVPTVGVVRGDLHKVLPDATDDINSRKG